MRFCYKIVIKAALRSLLPGSALVSLRLTRKILRRLHRCTAGVSNAVCRDYRPQVVPVPSKVSPIRRPARGSRGASGPGSQRVERPRPAPAMPAAATCGDLSKSGWWRSPHSAIAAGRQSYLAGKALRDVLARPHSTITGKTRRLQRRCGGSEFVVPHAPRSTRLICDGHPVESASVPSPALTVGRVACAACHTGVRRQAVGLAAKMCRQILTTKRSGAISSADAWLTSH